MAAKKARDEEEGPGTPVSFRLGSYYHRALKALGRRRAYNGRGPNGVARRLVEQRLDELIATREFYAVRDFDPEGPPPNAPEQEADAPRP